MKQFAVYFIPSDISFYQKGSEIIGYDILGQKNVSLSKDKQTGLAQKLNSQSRQYGFHLTITDVVDIDEIQFAKAVRRTRFIFSLPIFRDIKIEGGKIGLMPNANVLAIQFKNNPKLYFLHLLLVFFVQRLGSRSYYTNHIDSLNLLRKIKTRLFLSPYIIDDFIPHITLVQNFPTKPPREMLQYLAKPFKNSKYLNIKQIAVVVKEPEEECFRILEIIGIRVIINVYKSARRFSRNKI